MLTVYLWLRFDPVIRLGFGTNWLPRYEFMMQIFGESATQEFFRHRQNLVQLRKKKIIPYILPSTIEQKTNEFLKIKISNKTCREKRLAIIKKLIFWATDPEINRENIDSYQTRSAIVNALFDTIFSHSLYSESDLILNSLDKIVFNRVTYQGHRGEPSPIVHDTILLSVGRLLQRHFNEIFRLRDLQIDKMTTMQILKELNKSHSGTGSIAFSGELKTQNEFRHKFPLTAKHAKFLFAILNHYQFSAWPDSRENAKKIISDLEDQLKMPLKVAVEIANT